MSSWVYSLLAHVATYANQAVSVDVPEILELSAKVRSDEIPRVNNRVHKTKEKLYADSRRSSLAIAEASQCAVPEHRGGLGPSLHRPMVLPHSNPRHAVARPHVGGVVF